MQYAQQASAVSIYQEKKTVKRMNKKTGIDSKQPRE